MRTSLTLIALLALISCSKPKAEEEAQSVVPVQVADVQRDSIQRVVSAEAILFPVDQAGVMPKISAPVKTFSVKRGDHVSKNQVVAVLENRDLQAAVAEAQQLYQQAQSALRTMTGATVPEDLNKARADFDAAKQALDAAQKVHESRKQLFEQGALARRLVDEAGVSLAQARSQYDIAQKHLESVQNVGRQEQVKTAQSQVDAAKARLEAAQAQLSYSEIRSPISGTVSDRPLYAGEMAAAGAPLLTIVDLSRVIARANVPVAQSVALKVGMPAGLTQLDAQLQGSGKVTVVSPAVDPNSTTVEVWAEAPNPGERFKPGATVRVEIFAETIQNAIVIPAAALLGSQEGGVHVMVVGPDSVAHERKVELGVRQGDKVQVLSGLQGGEKVIIVGGVGLEDGSKVKVGAAESEKSEKEDKGEKSDKDEKSDKAEKPEKK